MLTGEVGICPICANEFPLDHIVWVVYGKFLCSEPCAREAARRQ